MNYPWYVLVDEPTDAVLIALQDPVIAQRLRQGILDAHVVTTSQEYQAEVVEYTGFARSHFFALPQEKYTANIVKKKQLLKLRLPAFLLWKRLLLSRLNESAAFYVDIDWSMQEELKKSSPDNPSEGLLDYAYVSNIPVAEVYEYFKLYVQERSHSRLTLHARAEKYSRSLNLCMNADQIQSVCKEMNEDFMKTSA